MPPPPQAFSAPPRATDRLAEDASPPLETFSPSMPLEGSVLLRHEPLPLFSWKRGGFQRFRIEFSADPTFSEGVVRGSRRFKASNRYRPGRKAWTQIRALGSCGQPVYWRVLASLPGRSGAARTERTSWFTLRPEAGLARLAIAAVASPEGPESPEAASDRRVWLSIRARSASCTITGTRIDFDGDGWWDVETVSNAASIASMNAHDYPLPGRYVARAEVFQGAASLAAASLLVEAGSDLDHLDRIDGLDRLDRDDLPDRALAGTVPGRHDEPGPATATSMTLGASQPHTLDRGPGPAPEGPEVERDAGPRAAGPQPALDFLRAALPSGSTPSLLTDALPAVDGSSPDEVEERDWTRAGGSQGGDDGSAGDRSGSDEGKGHLAGGRLAPLAEMFATFAGGPKDLATLHAPPRTAAGSDACLVADSPPSRTIQPDLAASASRW